MRLQILPHHDGPNVEGKEWPVRYAGKPGRTLNGVLNLMSPPNGSRFSWGRAPRGRTAWE